MKKEQSYDEALAVLLRMLQRAPNSSRLHHEIANNYRWRAKQSGDPHDQTLLKRCVFHLEEGARLNPTHIYPQVRDTCMHTHTVINTPRTGKLHQIKL